MTKSMEKYLAKQANVASRPHAVGDAGDIDLVVVIPVLAEEQLLSHTLAGLASNPREQLERTLVICVVNNRTVEYCATSVIEENQRTLSILHRLIRRESVAGFDAVLDSGLRLGYIDASTPGNELSSKEGVGAARKLGMDWGLALLADADPQSVALICLDADTRVDTDYLIAIRDHFSRSDAWGAVIDYAHELPEDERARAAIVCYELFLRYHELGLHYARSPYAYHTIGSTMACTAEAYAAVSGMNRRQAGEDFYFLEKLRKSGPIHRIVDSTVVPSGRVSERVPFGTGARMKRFHDGTQDEYLVYHPDSYEVLRRWIELVEMHPTYSSERILAEASKISSLLPWFLTRLRFEATWPRLQRDNPTPFRFLKQFHRWFDALHTLHLIHFLRDNGYAQTETFTALESMSARVRIDMSDINWTTVRQSLDEQVRLLNNLRAHMRSPRYIEASLRLTA